MTVPIRAKRPLANLRSLQATNTDGPFLSTAGWVASTVVAGWWLGHPAADGTSRAERRWTGYNFRQIPADLRLL
ncbi:hypothetical protein GCM10027186_45480 [Micromonospora schwarzwaldensis]